jgi:hypothetical protein
MQQLIDPILVYLPLFAIVISIGSLIYLSLQIRNNSTSTIASLYEEVAERMLDIDKLFLSYPEMRPYFYDSKTLPPSSKVMEYHRCLAMAETFLDFMDLVIVLRDITDNYKTSRVFRKHLSEWSNYFLDVYSTSPVIRKFLKEHEDWYSDQLVVLLKNKKGKL